MPVKNILGHADGNYIRYLTFSTDSLLQEREGQMNVKHVSKTEVSQLPTELTNAPLASNEVSQI